MEFLITIINKRDELPLQLFMPLHRHCNELFNDVPRLAQTDHVLFTQVLSSIYSSSQITELSLVLLSKSLKTKLTTGC